MNRLLLVLAVVLSGCAAERWCDTPPVPVDAGPDATMPDAPPPPGSHQRGYQRDPLEHHGRGRGRQRVVRLRLGGRPQRLVELLHRHPERMHPDAALGWPSAAADERAVHQRHLRLQRARRLRQLARRVHREQPQRLRHRRHQLGQRRQREGGHLRERSDPGPAIPGADNSQVSGVFPYGCDICVARQQPPCGIAPCGSSPNDGGQACGCKTGGQYNPTMPCQVTYQQADAGSLVNVTLLP